MARGRATIMADQASTLTWAPAAEAVWWISVSVGVALEAVVLKPAVVWVGVVHMVELVFVVLTMLS